MKKILGILGAIFIGHGVMLTIQAASQPDLVVSIQSTSIADQQVQIFKKIMTGGLGPAIVNVLAVQPWMHAQNQLGWQQKPSLDPRMWYKGAVMHAAARVPTMGMQYLAYDAFVRFLSMRTNDGPKKLSLSERILAASSAGALSAILGTPTEMLLMYHQNLAMQKTIHQRAVTVYSAAQSLIAMHGMRSFGRGFLPIMLRNKIVTTAWALPWGSCIGDMLELDEGDEWATNLAGAVTAGFFAALFTTPLQKAKILMQGDIEGKVYPTMCSVFKKLYTQKGGLKTLMTKDFGLRTGQVMTSILFLRIYCEALKTLGLRDE